MGESRNGKNAAGAAASGKASDAGTSGVGVELSSTLEAGFVREEKKLTEWMIDHPREVQRERQEFLRQLQKKRCSYGDAGGVLPITLVPLFLRESSLELISNVAETLDRALDRVVKAYFRDEHVRSYFPYTDVPKEWIEWDPGYKKPTMISRHDAFFDGKTLKFLEFNCDNPGARGWANTYEDLFRNYAPYRELIDRFAKPSDRDLLRALMETFLSCYREAGGQSSTPRVGLVSWKEHLAGSDNEIVRDYLIENGIDAHFVDAREFEHRGGKLMSSNVRFDIVNLTLRFTFFKRFPRETREFLDAIRDRSVCAINPFRATIGSQKEAMSFLTNIENHHYFTKEEVDMIKAHIPWTRRMDETITMSPEGADIALHEYCLRNREKLVLKPTEGAGGHGVHVGNATEKDKWDAAVANAIGCPWWIVQEAVTIPEIEVPILKDNKVVLEKRYLNINPYIFNGKYAGCIGRVSDSKVVNVSSGGGLIPIFALKGDQRKREKTASESPHRERGQPARAETEPPSSSKALSAGKGRR